MTLDDIGPEGFLGIVPTMLCTASRAGIPNVTYISQVHYIDARRVALSRQFFNKTTRNLDENPFATVLILHPVTFAAYSLRLRFDHSEIRGALFEAMALRIQAIASHTGMTGVFKLISADVFTVLSVEEVDLFEPAPVGASVAEPGPAQPTELFGLQVITARINAARCLEDLLGAVLGALDELYRFTHAMVLLVDDGGRRLVTLASHGYGDSGVGAEIVIGEGIIGTVAAERRVIRVAGVPGELRYGRAIRDRFHEVALGELRPEIPLPGLADASSQLALPLVVQDRLVGVLALESRDPLCFANCHEAFLDIVANQIAFGVDRMLERGGGDDADDDEPETAPPVPATAKSRPRRAFVYYRNDDCIFVDGEYLIRNVPGKILWKLLAAHRREGRTEFSNRELRLDPSLGLPPFKDNLESRLILLRRRLEQKCPEVRLVRSGRGKFTLALDCAIELSERDSG
jgi:hypothetical protein